MQANLHTCQMSDFWQLQLAQPLWMKLLTRMYLSSSLPCGCNWRCIKKRPYFHVMLNSRVFINQTAQKHYKLAVLCYQSVLRDLLCNISHTSEEHTSEALSYLWRAAVMGKDSVAGLLMYHAGTFSEKWEARNYTWPRNFDKISIIAVLFVLKIPSTW